MTPPHDAATPDQNDHLTMTFTEAEMVTLGAVLIDWCMIKSGSVPAHLMLKKVEAIKAKVLSYHIGIDTRIREFRLSTYGDSYLKKYLAK